MSTFCTEASPQGTPIKDLQIQYVAAESAFQPIKLASISRLEFNFDEDCRASDANGEHA
jgi:hypothetical protein